MISCNLINCPSPLASRGSTMSPSTISRLHTLPAELRLDIYELVVVDSKTSPTSEPPLMQTCKTVRAEMIPTYLKHLDTIRDALEDQANAAETKYEAAKDWSNKHPNDVLAACASLSSVREYHKAMHGWLDVCDALDLKKRALEREDLATATVSTRGILGEWAVAVWKEIETNVRIRV